ncbi:MAG: hypothetical protein HZA93_24480 [Verrucomicrobia bacterium]|nr:hypothetical protein [Verrucomicrobiota bacterium]
MTNLPTFQSWSRGLKPAALIAFVIGHSSPGLAATPSARVAAIQPTRVADLILLDHGYDVGLRQGMVCRVSRGQTEVAEVLLVDLRNAAAAALILSVAPKQTIRAGDTASVKILKT